MNKFFQHILAAGFAAICTVPAAAADIGAPKAAASCEVCHGAGGDSKKADVPRLNGQNSDYILIRLREFLDPTRGTPHSNRMMWENATRISDDEAVALARYFSSQAATRPSASGLAQSQAGAQIYRAGAGPDIPACATCHGSDGRGLGSTPRIAGQHENYLMGQLEAFMLTARAGSPMNHHTWDMTSEQMRQVSAYLANN
jgi:cytochrome c553